MSETTAIQEYIQRQRMLIDEHLRTLFPAQWTIPAKLKSAMEYSLGAGGKRMRPILALAVAGALEGPRDAAMLAACAIEMIHTYSLIHDDLPAMDNDDYRRGKLTNHKVFGEGMAILAGDALLTHAFHSLVEIKRLGSVPMEQIIAMVEELSTLAGAQGMVGGQAADLLGEQGLTNLAELNDIHKRKTSDLIVFSLCAGGRVANATAPQLMALTTFGYNIGLAFQIKDDILDVTGDEVKLGKGIHSDERQHKVTYPYFIGLEASMRKVEELTEQGKEAIVQANFPHPERLLQIADYLMKRDY